MAILVFSIMLSKAITTKLTSKAYWKQPCTEWSIKSWEKFYLKKNPGCSKETSYSKLLSELEILRSNLNESGEKKSSSFIS
ncbi:hypothetical protein C2G38_2109283 [Gigaspora rosea]|uniref:Uncharacterized protein n=1 Tax=Gigaspora rosea TaxID=44941 RepID=A0A397UPU9_9GLOM|nr:hypothetical protein C2G38_2109283 [Gigaspora rosea]